jgi:hydroxyethylthiazole kinase-like uncharacterized protein yjeF
MPHVSPWSAAQTAAHLHRPTDDDDKYSRGVVGMRTGSARYPGAAVLGVEGAWRAGAGMVRYVGPDAAASLVLARRPETVRGEGRVQSWVMGSGMADADGLDGVDGILRGEVPIVLDAGALALAARSGVTAPRILTPHRGELARLRTALGLSAEWTDDADAAAETAAATGATVLLKGARTWVATPSGWLGTVISHAPWLSTAGTGDVLAGVLGALVAAAGATDPEGLGPIAASAAWLHGAAGRVASGVSMIDDGTPTGPGHPLVALEVAQAIPDVWAQLVA